MRRGPLGGANGLAVVRTRVQSLPERFRPEASDGFAGRIGLTVDDAPFQLALGRGYCGVTEGEAIRPAARVVTDAKTWLAIDDGHEVSSDALLAGRLSVRGNIDLANRLQSLFVPSGRDRLPADLEQVTIPVDGVRLSAYSFGEGPPLVLLHGLAASKLSWLPILRPLAERYRVIVPDLPGHGESSKPRARYTPAYYAGVVTGLLDTVGAENPVLIGNSMGGRVALEVARRSPDRVAGLVLLDPAAPGGRWAWMLQFVRVVPTGVAAIPVPFQHEMIKTAIRQLFAVPDRLPDAAYAAGADEFVRVHRSMRARMAVLASFRGLMADPRQEFWQFVRRIRLPSLIIWGAEDHLVSVRAGRRMASLMPASELHVLPSVGHVPQYEVPERTIDLVLRFLDQAVAPAA
ncbi:MAG: alpha/beta fold hydrolase [Actinomycetota bacterium]